MRSSKQRSRSKPNRPRTLGNIVNRVFDSSGPEGKVRGTPQQIIEKYQLLARDAQLSNDRVAYENFLQHCEHYTRMLGEATRELQREADERRDQQGGQNGQQNGQPRQYGDVQQRDDRDDEDQPEGYGDQPRNDQRNDQRNDTQRAEYQRNDSQTNGQNGNQNANQQRNNQPRYDQPRRNDQQRNDQPRADQQRNDQPRNDQPRNDQPRGDQQRSDKPRNDRPRTEKPHVEKPAADAFVAQPSFLDQPVPSFLEQPAVVKPAPTPRTSPVLDSFSDDETDTGLVETPEMRPEEKQAIKAPRRRPAPRKPKVEAGEGEPPATSAPEAAE